MYGNCPKCGWAMRVVVINPNGTVFVECSNPDCDNKWGEQLQIEVSVNRS